MLANATGIRRSIASGYTQLQFPVGYFLWKGVGYNVSLFPNGEAVYVINSCHKIIGEDRANDYKVIPGPPSRRISTSSTPKLVTATLRAAKADYSLVDTSIVPDGKRSRLM